MADVSRKTYAIEDSGPYDEDEAREKIRAYCDEHGFFAAATLEKRMKAHSESRDAAARRRYRSGHRASPAPTIRSRG